MRTRTNQKQEKGWKIKPKKSLSFYLPPKTEQKNKEVENSGEKKRKLIHRVQYLNNRNSKEKSQRKWHGGHY